VSFIARTGPFACSDSCSAYKKAFSLTSFQDFSLNHAITRALAEEKYATPTPIQTQTIPSVMAGRDVIGIAQTGTGKTAAFALPILHRLAADARATVPKSCRVLVLSPTRELSGQILDSFRAYGRHLRIRTALAIGGVSMGAQVRALLGGVDVLVATPGRLIDLTRGNALRLDRVECLVLDEADRMLDMGFIADIRKIVAKLPAVRQTLMFSATMAPAVAGLAQHMLRDPVRIAVSPAAPAAERIAQRLIRVERAAKPAMLVDVLRGGASDRVLIFTRTKHGADKVVRNLVKAGFAAAAIHGNKSQNQRERVLAAFRQGRMPILVATDIAARGIDVDGISHVINFDVPNVPETYVHRIGRTARAGAAGIAISLCDADEMPFVRDIEKLTGLAIAGSDSGAPARQHGRASAKAGGNRPPSGRPGQHRPHRHNGDAAKHHHRDRARETTNAIADVGFMRPHGASGRRVASHQPAQNAHHAKGPARA
jgi:ATP-dependent RNA helicase RhlE